MYFRVFSIDYELTGTIEVLVDWSRTGTGAAKPRSRNPWAAADRGLWAAAGRKDLPGANALRFSHRVRVGGREQNIRQAATEELQSGPLLPRICRWNATQLVG